MHTFSETVTLHRINIFLSRRQTYQTKEDESHHNFLSILKLWTVLLLLTMLLVVMVMIIVMMTVRLSPIILTQMIAVVTKRV